MISLPGLLELTDSITSEIKLIDMTILVLAATGRLVAISPTGTQSQFRTLDDAAHLLRRLKQSIIDGSTEL